VDIIVEYIFGFLVGLLVFQSLFMRGIMGGTYAENVRRTFLPELLSMNMMMAGMAPVMIFLMMGRDMRAMWPSEALFWFVMSLGVVAGFLIAYPINVWLVAKGMKHGLMTVETHASQGSHGHAGNQQHATHQPKHLVVTRPQLVALTLFTLFALIGGMSVPAAFVNLGVRAEEVRGVIMPPGMLMTPETPPDAMRDMAAADRRLVRYTAPASAKGDRVLAPRI